MFANSSKLGLACVGALIACGTLSGCNNAGQGALAGGGLGAAAGAIIGSLSGHAGDGAAIGAVVGGLGGAIIGDQNDRRGYAPTPVYGGYAPYRPGGYGEVYVYREYVRPYHGHVYIYERNTCERRW